MSLGVGMDDTYRIDRFQVLENNGNISTKVLFPHTVDKNVDQAKTKTKNNA